MDKKFIGIVLNKIDYKEKDNLINIFSPDEGILLCKLKGVKGASSKLKVLASPFCLAEFTAVTTNDKITITGGAVIDTFFDITNDIEKYYSAFCILHFIKQILKFEYENYNKLFTRLVNFLKTLCYNDVSPKLVLIKCLLEILDISGFNLNLNRCANCNNVLKDYAYIDIIDNSVKCANCTSDKSLLITSSNLQTLRYIQNNDYDKLNLELDKNCLNDLLRLLGNYIFCTFDYTLKLNELLNTYWQ